MTHKCTLCVSTLLTPVRPASSREQTSEVIFIVCFANIISVVIICLVWTFETRIVSTSWYDLYVCVRVRTSSYLIRSSFFDKKKKKISQVHLSTEIARIFVQSRRRWRACYRRYHYRLNMRRVHVHRAPDAYMYTCITCRSIFDLLRKQENRKDEIAPVRRSIQTCARTRVRARLRKISYLNRR